MQEKELNYRIFLLFLKNKDYYEMFKENFNKDNFGTSIKRLFYKYPNTIIFHAFSWKNTKEGYDFWNNIDIEWFNFKQKNCYGAF